MATSKYTFTLKSPFTSRLHRERQSVLHAEASTTSKTGWPNFWWLGRPISAWKLESRVDSKSIAMIFFVAFWKTSSIRLRLYWRNLPILAVKSSKIAACMWGGGKGKREGTHNHDHGEASCKKLFQDKLDLLTLLIHLVIDLRQGHLLKPLLRVQLVHGDFR